MSQDHPDDIPDPAAQAFERLRGEVALLRLALEGLAAAHEKIQIPDYSETLGRTDRNMRVVADRLKALAEMPALGLAPEDWGRRLAAASDVARREDQRTLESVQDELRQGIQTIGAFVASARTAQIQRRYLCWAVAGGFAGGAVLLAIAELALRHSFG